MNGVCVVEQRRARKRRRKSQRRSEDVTTTSVATSWIVGHGAVQIRDVIAMLS